MKHLSLILATSLALTGCFSSSNDKDESTPIVEGSYIVQLAEADWTGSSSVVTGNILGDRAVKNTIMIEDSTDFDLSVYGNNIFHLKRSGDDSITLYNKNNLSDSIWTYSTNADGEYSSNPYQVIQISESKAYVLRYDSNDLWVINPQAKVAVDFVTAHIDLSAYANGTSNVARMASAVEYNGKLFVIMQRLDSSYQPTENSCVAIIDTTTNTELNNETDTACVGTKGIKLSAGNAISSSMNNGYLYVANRGDYGSDSGSLDKVDLTTYQVSTIFDKDTTEFKALNNASSSFHIFDVVIVDNNHGYVQVEYGSWPNPYKIFPFNPSTKSLSAALDLAPIKDRSIADIALDPNNRLWVAVADAAEPKLVVIDTDTNTQSGDAVELEQIPNSIHFLTMD